MNSIAIITARGGSKRIPHKNIKKFCGKPIIGYSIEVALQTGLFDEVMVSTDDDEIAKIARFFGAHVPFLRSDENSDDFSDTTDVLVEVIEQLRQRGRSYSEFCCIYPTAPFVTAKKLIESHALLQQDNIHSVIPITNYSFPPQRGFVVKEGLVEPVDKAAFEMRSQDLTPLYHDCGQFYWCRTDSFLTHRNIVTNRTVSYLLPEIEVQDIDTEEDWALAELKYELMRRNR